MYWAVWCDKLICVCVCACVRGGWGVESEFDGVKIAVDAIVSHFPVWKVDVLKNESYIALTKVYCIAVQCTKASFIRLTAHFICPTIFHRPIRPSTFFFPVLSILYHVTSQLRRRPWRPHQRYLSHAATNPTPASKHGLSTPRTHPNKNTTTTNTSHPYSTHYRNWNSYHSFQARTSLQKKYYYYFLAGESPIT